jgi:hypothetical protein
MNNPEPGFYWAEVDSSDGFNAIVEVYGEPPFLRIDAHFLSEPRLLTYYKNDRQAACESGVSPSRVTFGPRLEPPTSP